MKIKKISFIIVMMLFSILFVTACGSKKPPELTKSMVSKDLGTELKNASYSFDSLDNFKYKLVDINDKDLKKLKEFFDNKVEYQKVDCSFRLTSIQMDSVGTFSMIYAYVNDEWKVMFSYPTKEDDWEFVAKETVNSKKILGDLKTVKFEGFEEGYVGSEKTTSIKVVDRDTKLKINKDDVFIEATVKTDFAEYVIEVELIYYFNNGEWKLSDAIVQDAKYWTLTYNSDKVPEAPSTEHILEQLTKQSNFLTYVANLEYMDSHNLVATKQLAGVTSITFEYEFSTVYKNIGTIKYIIQVPYEWLDGEWAIGDMVVKVSDININSMLGTWSCDNGDYIEFNSSEMPEPSEFKSPNIIIGTYFKKIAENTYSKYTIKCEINIPLRDNNWEGNIKLWEANDTSSIEFAIKAFSIDSQNKLLKADDLIFNKTAELPADKQIQSSEDSTKDNEVKSTEFKNNEKNITSDSKSTTSQTNESKKGIDG